MKIICVEEHMVDAGLAGAGPAEERALLHGGRKSLPGQTKRWRRQAAPGDRFSDHDEAGGDYGAGRLAEMDRHQIDMQILSCSNPPQDTPLTEEVALTKAANDTLAEAIRKNPSRFGGFASLPWQHPRDAAQEVRRSVTDLGFAGAMLLGRPDKHKIAHKNAERLFRM